MSGSRPIYETDRNRIEEDEIAWCVCEAWNLNQVPAPKLHCYDRLFLKDNRVVCVGEIKRREVRMDKYPNIILSKHKVDNILKECRKPAYFFVSFDDCLAYSQLRKGWRVNKGGRKDRNDSKDIELVYRIPIRDFNEIEKVPTVW